MPWKTILAPKSEGGWRDVYEEPGKEGMTHFTEPTITESVFEVDKNVDYTTGVKDFGFRADFSKPDTDEERRNFLTKKVGKEGWKTDRYGRYLLTPKGMNSLGLKATADTAIDEVWPTFYDIADWRGDAPAVGGAMVGGAVTGGAGIVPAMIGAGLGAAGAQGYQESAEALSGDNLQSSMEVAKDLGVTGGSAMLGEGIYRTVLGPIGRKLAAPYKKQMTPDKIKALKEAREIGAQPSFNQVVESSLPGRYSRISERIFGDPRITPNAEALARESARLAKSAYPVTTSKGATGKGIYKGLLKTKRAFQKKANLKYDKTDELLMNEAVIPTERLKYQVSDILNKLPKRHPDGSPVMVPNELKQYARDIMSLDDYITVSEMKSLRTYLMESTDGIKDVIPGLSETHTRRLISAASKSFDDATGRGIKTPAIRAAESKIAQLEATKVNALKEWGKFKTQSAQHLTMSKDFHSPQGMPKVPQQYTPHKALSGEAGVAASEQATFINQINKEIAKLKSEMPVLKRLETARMDKGVKALKEANEFYRRESSKLDDVIIKNILKEKGKPGAIDHELVVDKIFRPGKHSQLARVMSSIPKKDQMRVQGVAMRDLLDSAITRTDDPFTDLVNGRSFLDTLDKYGKPTLNQMFGKQRTDELYRFGRVAHLVSKKQKDQGGLIAAAIAVRPLKNIGTLAKLRIWFEVFNHPRGLKWLTTGLEAPKTRAGVEAMSRFSTLVSTTVDDIQTEQQEDVGNESN